MAIEIEFSGSAEESLAGIARWLEYRNSPGSGERFLDNFSRYLNRLKKSYPYYSPCPNRVLRSKGLYCAKYREWIVAFVLVPERLIVRAFIHKKQLPHN